MSIGTGCFYTSPWPGGQVQVCNTALGGTNPAGVSIVFNIQDEVMIFSYGEINETVLPAIIEGIVVNKSNNDPVAWTHVFIENSEEDSLTTTGGEFKILSWKKFPVTLIIRHVHYETVRLTVTCTQPVLVFLKEK